MKQNREIFTEENEEKLKNLNIFVWKLLFKFLIFIKNFIIAIIPTLIKYAIVSAIYLSVLNIKGFETAVILALCGVIIVASKQNRGSSKTISS